MKKIMSMMIVIASAITSFSVQAAVDFSTVTKYAAACESELGFDAAQVPALIKCSDGVVFNVEANDMVGRAQVNLYVDLVFACRHVSANGAFAASIELLIHNRSSGSTCFFAAKDPLNNPSGGPDPLISTGLLPPTSPYADLSWMTNPNHLGDPSKSLGTCVRCHVAGPYIASPSIAPALAEFGLLNDGHDTFATRYHSVGSLPSNQSAIPSVQNPFVDWDNIVFRNNVTAVNTCANGCHSIGLNNLSRTQSIFSADGSVLIPSLKSDIDDVSNAGVMPADNPTDTSTDNSYNWINMNSPLGTRGDFETLSAAQYFYPKFSCANPTSVEAHVIGSNERIRTDEIQDRLNRFNLQDGLVCLNADQPNGRCHDYQVRYMCNGRFTAFQNNDTPGGSGDWEPRNGFKNLCSNPTWMQARYQWNGVWVYVNAPADRLAEFDTGGLVCHNADQNNGQCSNYVVRFNCQ